EIWASDGTARGTLSLRSFGSGFSCTYNRPVPLTQGGGGAKLLFTADDGVRGRELWQSDGTRAGTALVADLYPGPASGALPGGGGDPGALCPRSPALCRPVLPPRPDAARRPPGVRRRVVGRLLRKPARERRHAGRDGGDRRRVGGLGRPGHRPLTRRPSSLPGGRGPL